MLGEEQVHDILEFKELVRLINEELKSKKIYDCEYMLINNSVEDVFHVLEDNSEYYNFIKDYLKLAELKIKYVVINILSAFFYKGFSILLPLIASLIIKYLTDNNSIMTYYCLGAFLITYVLYNIALYINYKIYGFNMNYCYDKL